MCNFKASGFKKEQIRPNKAIIIKVNKTIKDKAIIFSKIIPNWEKIKINMASRVPIPEIERGNKLARLAKVITTGYIQKGTSLMLSPKAKK